MTLELQKDESWMTESGVGERGVSCRSSIRRGRAGNLVVPRGLRGRSHRRMMVLRQQGREVAVIDRHLGAAGDQQWERQAHPFRTRSRGPIVTSITGTERSVGALARFCPRPQRSGVGAGPERRFPARAGVTGWPNCFSAFGVPCNTSVTPRSYHCASTRPTYRTSGDDWL
jgi:hypothetical protein